MSAPLRISDSELQQIESLPEFKAYKENVGALKFDKATEKLQEAMNILKQVNQHESYGFLYLLRNMSNISFLNMDFDGCEKLLLEGNSLSNQLNGDNMQNRFLNQL